jgi:DsbC/DsbD-like thiol-disulfide interchange protein
VKNQGLGLAGISYDSPEILRAFTEKHGITFPLLSDPGSKTIDAWGIRNREATGRTAGIPYPGTYVIDRSGVIVSRAFESAYQERDTAASILASLQASADSAGATTVLGKYLSARVGGSDQVAAPGQRVTLTVDITPGKNVHVYAPGQHGYIPIALKFESSPDFAIGATTYPAPREYVFAPLKERVQVYDRPFRIQQDVMLALTPQLRQRATAKETLTIAGVLDYQACDDKLCFRPDSVPLRWSIALTPIER